MPEANQYSYNHKELVELLIRGAGIHEGEWMLSVQMGFSAINIGPEGGHNPAGLVIINKIGVQRVQENASPPSELVVNAAKVNPRREEANA